MKQWWTGLGEAGADNVVIMPGVSLTEAEQFVDIQYVGQNVISNEHFTVTLELEPYEIYDQFKL